ncbi:4-alpha-glucanotransferase [Thiomicrorhabdus sp.]|uniref:4-alpha-glucanotransferase n=1 Tax=Thiomicrorhabdus sp. TaxID=2039724 RepID=UPI0029C95568|nr:4-alpha-glucanotransferase [Thiomicrorhabdus sp.]
MNPRQAGVLLHPTSLPNEPGKLGVLNQQAWKFLDWMHSAGLKIWQCLPLTEPHDDLSPYNAVSAFALNPALLPDDWEALIDPVAFKAYKKTPPHWLEDYALFMAIRHVQSHRSWRDWPRDLRMRDRQALLEFADHHADLIDHLKKQQFALQTLWMKLKADANKLGIRLFGDMPIFVAFDSADVWANPQLFKLDKNLNPQVVAGVPPDYFSATGQRWGNPHYDWEVMKQDRFAWWRHRVSAALEQFDLIRIDHFRGLQACWEIAADAETAIDGRWVETPGDELLAELQECFPDLPLVAEDLGLITPEVVALKEHFELPGMSILQFGFNGLPDNPHALDEQVPNSVVYTGTHDNDTTLGWYRGLDAGTKTWVDEQLMAVSRNSLLAAKLPLKMPWPLIAAGFDSVADTLIVPMQDWLALGSEDRMNVPGTTDKNWRWQFKWDQLDPKLADGIRILVELNHR